MCTESQIPNAPPRQGDVAAVRGSLIAVGRRRVQVEEGIMTGASPDRRN